MKTMSSPWVQRIGTLALGLSLACAALADGWQYQYQAPEATALDSSARVVYLPQAITSLSNGFAVTGTRIQDGRFTGSPILIRYNAGAEIQSVRATHQSAMLFSGPEDVVVALDAQGISAQSQDGTAIYHWRYDFPAGASTQVQADASGNALVLRGGRALLASRLGVYDLGPARAIAADINSLYVARPTAQGTQIARIAQDGSVASAFLVDSGAEVLAFTLEPSNFLVLLANAGQVATQRYARADFSKGSRRTAVLATSFDELMALSQRFSAPIANDLSWRVLLSGEGPTQLFIFDQLGARFITLPQNVPCTADCRWQSTPAGESLYSAERTGSTPAKRQTIVLDAAGNVLDSSIDIVDSVHSAIAFAGGRILSTRGDLVSISSEYISAPIDQYVPASLRSVALLDDQGNSIAIGLNADLGLTRHTYINAQGARIWEQEFTLPLSGVATAADNAERYCSAMALTDRRIDVRCLDKRTGGLVEFLTLGALAGGSEATPRHLLASLGPDDRLALWIERGETLADRSIEYRELSPTVRITRESQIATQVNSAAENLLLAGRMIVEGGELIYLGSDGLNLSRQGQTRSFAAATFASFMPDQGLSLSLSGPTRLQRLNADLSPRFSVNAAPFQKSLSIGSLDIHSSDTRLFAVDRNQGTLQWDLSGDFKGANLLPGNERLLVLRTQADKVRLQQRSLSSGELLAERVFACVAPCQINQALPRPEQLRVQLDQPSELGLRMSVNGIEAPNSVPALSLSHPSLIGTWANPAIAGQNLIINRIPNSNLLFAGWNTQSPEPAQARGAQSLRWFVLLGEIAPLNVPELMIPIYQSSGGMFQSATPTPETKAVGRAFLRLSSCDQLSLRYDFDDNALDGELLLQRLLPATYPCLGLAASAATPADASVPVNTHSNWEGGWHDPATPGQGFFFSDTRISASAGNSIPFDLLYGSWQTFDASSDDPKSQHWFTLVANRRDNQLSAELRILQSAGGVFGRQSAGAEAQVGRGTISRLDCERLVFQYQFDRAIGQFSEKSGQIVLHRLGGCAR